MIHVAALAGRVDMIRHLLEKIKDDENRTAVLNCNDNGMRSSPLASACFLGQHASVVELVRHGASLDTYSWNGATPLWQACNAVSGSSKTVDFLLLGGADPHTRVSLSKMRPLRLAIHLVAKASAFLFGAHSLSPSVREYNFCCTAGDTVGVCGRSSDEA